MCRRDRLPWRLSASSTWKEAEGPMPGRRPSSIVPSASRGRAIMPAITKKVRASPQVLPNSFFWPVSPRQAPSCRPVGVMPSPGMAAATIEARKNNAKAAARIRMNSFAFKAGNHKEGETGRQH